MYRSKEGLMSPYLPQPHLGPSSFAQPPHFQGLLLSMSTNRILYNRMLTISWNNKLTFHLFFNISCLYIVLLYKHNIISIF